MKKNNNRYPWQQGHLLWLWFWFVLTSALWIIVSLQSTVCSSTRLISRIIFVLIITWYSVTGSDKTIWRRKRDDIPPLCCLTACQCALIVCLGKPFVGRKWTSSMWPVCIGVINHGRTNSSDSLQISTVLGQMHYSMVVYFADISCFPRF